jgi:hypothetical protein
LGCPLFCGPPGGGVAPVVFRVWLFFCLCCSSWLLFVFWLVVVVVLLCPLFAPGVFCSSWLFWFVVSPVRCTVLVLVAPGWFMLLLVRVLFFLVVGLLVLLSPLFCVSSCRFVTIWVVSAPGFSF